jgi:hypothetical protein
MPRRRLHHHAVSPLIAKGTPLHEALAEGGERLLTGFTSPK